MIVSEQKTTGLGSHNDHKRLILCFRAGQFILLFLVMDMGSSLNDEKHFKI